MRSPPEPVKVIKERREAVLKALVGGVPYIDFLGIYFDRRGDELTAVLPFRDDLIGNPVLPALHGGVTAAFLEVTAIIGLSWSLLWDNMENTQLGAAQLDPANLPRLPKTIDFTTLSRSYYRTTNLHPSLLSGSCPTNQRKPRLY